MVLNGLENGHRGQGLGHKVENRGPGTGMGTENIKIGTEIPGTEIMGTFPVQTIRGQKYRGHVSPSAAHLCPPGPHLGPGTTGN